MFVPSSVIGPGFGASTQVARSVTCPPVPGGHRSYPGSPGRTTRATGPSSTGRGMIVVIMRSSAARRTRVDGVVLGQLAEDDGGRREHEHVAGGQRVQRLAGRTHSTRSASPPTARVRCPVGTAATKNAVS